MRAKRHDGKRPIVLVRERRLTAGLAHHRSPTWSTDGKWLAFAVGDGSSSSWLVTDRRGRVAVALEGPAEGGAAFGPDGALAYGRRIGATSEIWFTPGGGVPGIRLLGGDGRLYRQPAFSPDGRYLVCASDAPGGVVGRTQLVSLELATGARRVLTDDATRSDNHPSFSPDGTVIFFEGAQAAESAVLVLDLVSGEISRITPDDRLWRRPAAVTAELVVAERHDRHGTVDRTELVLVGRARQWTIGTTGLDVREPAVRVLGTDDAPRVRLAYAALLEAAPGQPRRCDILVGRLPLASRDVDAEVQP